MKNERYEYLIKYLESTIEDEKNFIANISNASAIINENLDNLNWAGFYLYDDYHSVVIPCVWFFGADCRLRPCTGSH